MSPPQIYRLAAVSLMLGGLVGLVGANLPIPQVDDPNAVAGSPFWKAGNLMFWAGSLLGALAWPAFYARQARWAGKLGLMGFVLMMLSSHVLDLFTAPLRAFVIPWLLTTHITTNELEQMPLPFVPAGFALGLVGVLIYGVATLRARVFPRWAGVLLLIGTPLTLVAESVRDHLPWVLHNAGDDIFRLSVVLLGYALWLRAAVPAAEVQREPAARAGQASFVESKA